MPGVPVHTFWDLGVNDTTVIWFVQRAGLEWRVIDYYEHSGEGLEHYAKVLDAKADPKGPGYRYGRHYAPHDISVRELGTGISRRERGAELGIRFETVPRVENKADSIEAARTMLPQCWFDEEQCALGLERLEHYRKEWDDRLGCYRDRPLHDNNSNGADAFQTFAMAAPDITGTGAVRARTVRRRKDW